MRNTWRINEYITHINDYSSSLLSNNICCGVAPNAILCSMLLFLRCTYNNNNNNKSSKPFSSFKSRIQYMTAKQGEHNINIYLHLNIPIINGVHDCCLGFRMVELIVDVADDDDDWLWILTHPSPKAVVQHICGKHLRFLCGCFLCFGRKHITERHHEL